MGAESNIRQQVVRALRPLDAVSVENPAHPGTPDVNFVEGWIELKQIEAWPRRLNTPVRISHYTQQQKVWLMRRKRAGGRVYLLLRVNRDWLLFDDYFEDIGGLPRDELELRAIRVWNGGLEPEQLLHIMRGGTV